MAMHRLAYSIMRLLAPAALLALTACQTPPTLHERVAEVPNVAQVGQTQEEFTLQGGDTVKISFPGAPNLDSTQQIRRDGRINLPMAGEIVAAGKTPLALEKELVAKVGTQLVSKEVTVTVVSAPFAVFVSGAVLRPGKISSDRPISVLEAIMEAGGFDMAKANMSAVVVIRQNGQRTENFTLNLKQVLEGKQSTPFFLRRSDVVHVPEKFNWF